MTKGALTFMFFSFSFILTFYAKLNISFAEFYALKIYPVFAETVSFFTSRVKFSLAEFIIIFVIIISIIYIVFTLIKTIVDGSSVYLKSFITNTALSVSIVLFFYVIFCGINYYRYEFTYYSGLKVRESTRSELIDLCEILIDDANLYRDNLGTGNNNTAELYDVNYLGTAERTRAAFDNISKEYDVLSGNYPTPKLVKLSKGMSHMRITGMFFPFTFEANINKDIPPYQVPSTMLHELVHLRGFMREDEANFISYLACINSGFDDFSYSGTMLALSYSMNSLYRVDSGAYADLYERLSQSVKDDMKFSSNYWSQFETKVSEISSKVNDGYLKANNQEDGVKSYGRMVDLLLAYYSESINQAEYLESTE